MEITPELVREVARLARLALDDDAVEAARGQLAAMLDYVAKLQELDVDHIAPTDHPLAQLLVMREDGPPQPTDRQTLLDLAPASDGEHFLVPKVIEDA